MQERLLLALLLVRVLGTKEFYESINVVSIQKASKYSNRSSSDPVSFEVINLNAGTIVLKSRSPTAIISWYIRRIFFIFFVFKLIVALSGAFGDCAGHNRRKIRYADL
jgi:hypothetical protein